MNFKILNTIGEGFTPEAKSIMEKLGQIDYRTLTQNELREVIASYEGIVVGLGLVLNKEILEVASNLKFIATATTGLDHIDVAFAKKRGIEVLSLRNDLDFMKRITGTAELAWGLLLSLVRKIPQSFDAVKRGEWRRDDYKGNMLSGKTLGIIGLGRLGSLVAEYGKAFGMGVIFTDPGVQSVRGEKVSFDELLRRSDVVTLHLHLSPETENLISEKEIALMKPNAILINTSRGKIVDEEALLQALKNKKIAGYATDVLSDEIAFGEKIPSDNALIFYAKENDNLLIVPHIGGMTIESRILTDIRIAEKVKDFISR